MPSLRSFLNTSLILAVVLLAAGQSTRAQDAPALTDSSLIRVASAIVANVSDVSRVWPGFWSEEQAFLLLRSTETALLITPRLPPEAYRAIPDSTLPSALRGLAYRRKTYPPELSAQTFSLHYPVGSDTIPALAPKGSTLFNQLEFYLHESFHGYQRANWAETPDDTMRAGFGEPLVNPLHTEAPEFRARGEVERRILNAALTTASKDSLGALMQSYLAVRHLRTQGLQDVRAVERRMERREGTAQYVGCRAAALATRSPSTRALECIRKELTTPLDSLSNFPEADARLMRWRQYGTGAALSMILERLDVPKWKEAVAKGRAPGEILAEFVAYNPDPAANLAEFTLERFGYAELLRNTRTRE